jgi:hypothetical protein
MKNAKHSRLPHKTLCAALVALSVNVSANSDLPDYYSAPGLSMDRDYINEHASEYIDPFSGKLQLHHTDIVIPGNGGLDITIQRSYTSLDDELVGEKSVVGEGWTMHFGRVVMRHSGTNWPNCLDTSYTSDSDNPVLELPDGSREALLHPTGTNSIVQSRGYLISSGSSTTSSVGGGL